MLLRWDGVGESVSSPGVMTDNVSDDASSLSDVESSLDSILRTPLRLLAVSLLRGVAVGAAVVVCCASGLPC